MPTITERLETVTSQIEGDAQIQHDIVNGPASGAGSTVTTEGGPVKSLAKAVADAEALIVSSVGDLAGAVADAEDARDVALGAMVALTVDVVNYGVTPAASAATNRAGLQAAFDAVESAGGGEVQFNVPGEYALNATVFVPSRCRIVFAPGAVLKKSTSYGEVLLNKGALTGVYNEDIEIIGLRVKCNGQAGVVNQNVLGLMGILGFVRVRRLSIIRLVCTDLLSGLFLTHFALVEDATIREVLAEGAKDIFHVSGGCKRMLFEMCSVSNYDDAFGINAGDYYECSPYIGDIEDIIIDGFTDRYYDPGYGSSVRLLTSSWGAYAAGMTVSRGTTVVAGGYIYRCANAVGSGLFTSAGAGPSHTTIGQIVTGADGIQWACRQVGTETSASIRRVTIRNARFENVRPTVYASWFSQSEEQSVTPGTEGLSEIDMIIFDKCSRSSALAGKEIILQSANLKRVFFRDCDGLQHTLTLLYSAKLGAPTIDYTPPANFTTTLFISGCAFPTWPTALINCQRPGTTTHLVAWNNTSPNTAVPLSKSAGGLIRAPKCDLMVDPFYLTLVAGDLARTIYGWAIVDSGLANRPIASQEIANTFGALNISVANADDALLEFWRGTSSAFGWKWKLNGASTGNLELWRTVSGVDTKVLTFARSTGRVTFEEYAVVDGTTGKTLRIANGNANGSVATTLGSTGPTGSTAGAPQGWMRISVNGADRFIPYW